MSSIFEFQVFDEPAFRFAVDSRSLVEEAVSIVVDRLPRGVMGLIVKEPAGYNPRWSFHLDPPSIEFFDFAIEVCDATPLFVEENLDKVGGSLLPDSRWCPWQSKLTGEIVNGSSTESIEAAIDNALASASIRTNLTQADVIATRVDTGGAAGVRQFRVELRVSVPED